MSEFYRHQEIGTMAEVVGLHASYKAHCIYIISGYDVIYVADSETEAVAFLYGFVRGQES